MKTAQTNSGGGVLVVGCGFIGRHLAARLDAEGRPVTVLTRTEPPRGALPPGARLIVGDAADPGPVARGLEGVEHVIHCAGSLMPAASNVDPAGDAALALPPLLTVLDALRARTGVALTLLSSGGTVYGRPARLPVDEHAPTDPISGYGVLKLAGEKYAGLYSHLHGFPIRVLRCANVFGPGQPVGRGQGAVGAFVDGARRGRPVPVYGDGSAARDFVFIEDVMDVLVGLLDRRDGPRILNVGSGRGTSISELVRVVGRVAGGPLQVDQRPARPGDVGAIVLDITRLTSLLPGFSPIGLDEGVARTWAAGAHAAAAAERAAS